VSDTLHTWYRIEFHAAAPVGEVITDLDPPKVRRLLADVFGFALVDGLTVARCELPPSRAPDNAKDPAPPSG